MKIIRVNNSQEKVKYEIYNMQLNQEKARRYREEQIKKLRFYKLIAHSVDDIECLADDIHRGISGKQRNKTIIGIDRTIPISKKEVNCNESVKYSFFSKGTKLYPYSEDNKFDVIDCRMQKEVIEFISDNFEQCLFSRTDCWSVDSFSTELNCYFFPYCFVRDKRYRNNGFCANVLPLSNEMFALYLLQKLEERDDLEGEKGDLEHYEEYLQSCINNINLKNRNSLMENIRFVREATIPEKTIDALANVDIVDQHGLQLKISRDKIYTSYIK